ncbi:hypothetical protein QYF36_019664 [Acer negundo]|nr:hypothetical protein QYF36_019664 [Acer negundo]
MLAKKVSNMGGVIFGCVALFCPALCVPAVVGGGAFVSVLASGLVLAVASCCVMPGFRLLSNHLLCFEILALARACELCAANPTLSGKNIEFISDLQVAISWVNDNGIGSMKHVQYIYDIRCHLAAMGQARVMYCSRASDSFVDMLAKQCSRGGREVLTWSDV